MDACQQISREPAWLYDDSPGGKLIEAAVLPDDYDFNSHKKLVPMQPGDVPMTYADTTPLEQDFGFKPSTSLHDGLRRFAEWYAGYYFE